MNVCTYDVNQSGRVNGIDDKKLKQVAESMLARGWLSYEPAAMVPCDKPYDTTARAVIKTACPGLVYPVTLVTGYDDKGKPENVEITEIQAEDYKVNVTGIIRHGVTRYCACLLVNLTGKVLSPVTVRESESEPASGLTVAGVLANEKMGAPPAIDDYLAVMRPVWIAGKRRENAILKALNGITGAKGKAQKMNCYFQLEQLYKAEKLAMPETLKNSNHTTLGALIAEIKGAGGVAQAEEKRNAALLAADAASNDENTITAMPVIKDWETANIHKLPVVAQSLLIALQGGNLSDVRTLCDRFKPAKPVAVDTSTPGVTVFKK